MESSVIDPTGTCYGKTGVKLLFIRRGDGQDDISELEVSTLLQLNDLKDYIEGDNSLVIPTDTQKNLVYIIAQKYGVECPETFALHLVNHFLSAYPQVVSARVSVVTVHGWRRLVRGFQTPDGLKEGVDHKHAFISSPECSRNTEVFQKRGEPPLVAAGLKGLRLLKTTNSAFEGFHKCEGTTLKEAKDRVLSTVVEAQWKYTNIYGLDFCQAWSTVVDCILEKFAGPANEGICSPSVQLTIYDAEKLVLSRVPQVSEIWMSLPNVHYFDVDMARFGVPSLQNTKNVYLPTDKPSGVIKATLRRNQTSKL